MTKDLTKGKPMTLIIGFGVPIFLSMLFQQFYNVADTMIVGKFLGVKPLAGVGATGSLNYMVIGLVTGLCNGFAIPIAQMFGAKQEKDLRKYVTNSLWLCIFFSVVLTVVAVIFCRQMLSLLDTPKDIFEYAYRYIIIIFWGITCTFLYNMPSAIIRALGDSRTPVFFLAVSSIINIVLDLVFIINFHMGVEGAALATVISQGVSGIACLCYMKKKLTVLNATKDEWAISRTRIAELNKVGIPVGLQYSVTAIGTLVLQFGINSFGSLTVAGVTAALKINTFMTCPFEALGSTMAAYTAQNAGAGRTDRITQGLKASNIYGFVMAAILLVVTLLTGKQLPLIFLNSPNEEVIRYAYQFLIMSVMGYMLLSLVLTTRFTIQAMGFSSWAMIVGFLETVARAGSLLLVPLLGYFAICLANVMAWIIALLFLIPSFFYCRRRMDTRIRFEDENYVK